MSEPSLEVAILRTLAYADVFDYPLRLSEIQRYLINEAATPDAIMKAMQYGWLVREYLVEVGGCYTLRDRLSLVALRQSRQQISAVLWPRALHYGRLLSGLPFVRMVAVTGALAMNNVDGRADLDYLVVTEPGRLWLCRLLSILLVRIARRRGEEICPNYLISEDTLSIPERNLYTAHELVQMIPLSGMRVYWRMRQVNHWTDDYLPNAAGLPEVPTVPAAIHALRSRASNTIYRRVAEPALRTTAGSWLEGWEMRRKIRKFSRNLSTSGEVQFGPDWCKGHFDGHGVRAMLAYQQRLRQLGLADGVRVAVSAESIPAGMMG